MSGDVERNGIAGTGRLPPREEDDASVAEQPLISRPTTPLPRLQIFVICVSRFAEPIAMTNIFPFIYFMIKDFYPDIQEDKVGYYVGSVESCFALAQFATVFWWGRLSDRIGRRPVILIGLSGVILSSLLFGLAKSLWFAIIARMLNGVLNGNISIYKSMMGEITDETNQARAFSFLNLCFAIGSIIGPMIGGFLARPSEQFPKSSFFQQKFWLSYPYFLPCAVSAGFVTFSLIVASLYMQETLPSKIAAQKTKPALANANGSARNYGTMSSDETMQGDNSTNASEEPPSIGWRLFCTKPIVILLADYMILALQCIALDALLYLFCATPVENGGLSFSSGDIGIILSIHGVTSVFNQVVLFPPLQKRLGTAYLWRVTMAMYPFIFAAFPIVNAAARGYGTLYARWTGMIIIILLKATANMAFGCNMILVNSNSPSRHALGTMNGIAQSCASFVRAIGPASATSLFAWSISNGGGKGAGALHGQAVWVILSLLAMAGSILSFWVREGQR